MGSVGSSSSEFPLLSRRRLLRSSAGRLVHGVLAFALLAVLLRSPAYENSAAWLCGLTAGWGPCRSFYSTCTYTPNKKYYPNQFPQKLRFQDKTVKKH
eukprot:4847559-Amphidinium_carterae.1